MENKIYDSKTKHYFLEGLAENKKGGRLERITSLTMKGAIFVLMSNYLINNALHRYFT